MPPEPAVPDEAGEDVGEAPRPEQVIDLEKELGEDIHLPGSTVAPAKGPSLADALKSVRLESAPGENRPFVAPTPLREIPNVPSGAPMPVSQKKPEMPAAQVVSSSAVSQPTAPQPTAAETASRITPVAVMHPETSKAPVQNTPPTLPPIAARGIDAARATSLLSQLETAAAKPATPKPAGSNAPLKTPTVAEATAATAKEAQPANVAVPASKATAAPTIVGAPKQRLSIVEQLREQSDSPLHPLRTYKTDAEESVKHNRTSLVTMAAAEESRRTREAQTALVPQSPRAPFPWKRLLIGTLTALFIVGGCAAAFYIYVGPPPVDTPTSVQASNILYVDESVEQSLVNLDHLALVTKLAELRDQTVLSLGLVREVYFTLPDEAASGAQAGETKRLATTQEVLSRLAPNMPQELLRTLLPEFILGVHVFDNNQGLLVIRSENYQQAFSGMLAWETSMRSDLLPFIDRRPRPKLPNEATNSTTTPRVIASSFVDRVVRNLDARVLYNDAGDIVLLYSFIDQQTIAITTNENTLFEIASRLRERRF